MLCVAVLRCASGIASTPVIILVFTKLTKPEVFEDSTNPLRNAKSALLTDPATKQQSDWLRALFAHF